MSLNSVISKNQCKVEPLNVSRIKNLKAQSENVKDLKKERWLDR